MSQKQMDRIRAARGLPPQTRENLMERVAAASTYINRAVSNPKTQADLELLAFMSIFHPEVPEETVNKMRLGLPT